MVWIAGEWTADYKLKAEGLRVPLDTLKLNGKLWEERLNVNEETDVEE